MIAEPRTLRPPDLLTLGAYATVLVASLFYHEMWRDELQAWMVARDAESLGQLYANMKYEGNPLFWHLFLYAFTRWTSNPLIMRVFHVVLSVAAVFVFLRHAPFDRAERILFVFGYYVFYEYAVIARSYALGLLLLFIALALARRRRENFAATFFVLALLANTHLFGAILAAGLGLVLLLEAWPPGPDGRRPRSTWDFAAIAAWAGGILLCLHQVRAEEDNTFAVAWLERLVDLPRLDRIGPFLFGAYAPIPDPRETAFWNHGLFDLEPGRLILLLALGCAAAGTVALRRTPLLAAFHAGCCVVYLGLFYFSQLVWWRYVGHLYLALIAALWLARQRAAAAGPPRHASPLSRSARPLLVALLVLQAIGGVAAHLLDLRRPFSQARAAADFLIENGLDALPIVAYRDYAISPLGAHLDRPLWYPQSGRPGSFVIYDRRRKPQLGLEELTAAVRSALDREATDRVLLVLYAPLRQAQAPDAWQRYDAELAPGLRARLLAYFEGAAVGDENFYIYLVRGRTGATAG